MRSAGRPMQLAVTFTSRPPDRPGDHPQIEATILDAVGAPLNGAAVSIEAFHNAHSDDIIRGALIDSGDGTYTAHLPLRHNGRWEMRFVVQRGSERFTHSETKHLFVEYTR